MACMAWQQAAGTGPHQVRRRSAAAALLAAGLGAVLPGPAQAATVLRVLAWPGYADADFVAVFEKRHGVKVEITTVASDDVLRATLARQGYRRVRDEFGADVCAGRLALILREHARRPRPRGRGSDFDLTRPLEAAATSSQAS